MIEQGFTVRAGEEMLVGDLLGTAETSEAKPRPLHAQALFLHGAGQSSRRRQRELREDLALAGFGNASFDFSGHGDSSANTPGSLEKRLKEAQHVLRHVDATTHQRIHTLVGVSMSGEIALRLACLPPEQIEHVVLIVGAIYDRAAFRLPFGPAFSEAIRRQQSWRNAETLELIAGYRGGLTLIRALDDAVIPHEIPDLLAQAARSACFCRIIDLPLTDHRVSEKMSRDLSLRRCIAAAIRSADQGAQ